MAYQHRTLIDALQACQGKTQTGFTFTDPDGKETFFSWDLLRLEAAKRARHLRSLGMKKGDRLALVLPDTADFVPTFLGATWAGIVPVPLYPPLSLGKLDAYLAALTSILQAADPMYLCASSKVEQVLWSVLSKVPSIKGMLPAEELARAEAVQEPLPANAQAEALVDSDLAFLQFTSGSTSTPKGVMVTHGSLGANCNAIMSHGLKCTPSDVAVSWLPLYHDMGLIGFVLAPFFTQVPVTFLPTLSFVKNASLWMETINKKRGTLTFAPNFAYALAAKRVRKEHLERWDLSCLRAMGCGAEPVNPNTLRNFVETFKPCGLKPTALLPAYGLAEATLAVSFIGLDEELKTDRIDSKHFDAAREARPAQEGGTSLEVVCLGKAFPEHELAVVDANDNKLPERKVGEVVLRGPSVAAGYFKNPEASQKLLRNGWLHTGDLGYLANGELFLAGRQKDLIIVNGRNYDPQRVEWLCEDIPGVRKGSIVAFSRPGQASEELVVVLEHRGQAKDEVKKTITQKIAEQLQLTVADISLLPPGTLPKTSSGKLQRQKTRSQYLDGTLGTEGVRTLGGTAQTLMLAKHLALSFVGKSRHLAQGFIKRNVARLLPSDDSRREQR